LFDSGAAEARFVLAELALKHHLATIFGAKENVVAGGLLGYGVDRNDLNRRAALYIDKILKGAKPADLPVEQPTKFELVVNLKTARARNQNSSDATRPRRRGDRMSCLR
jgi:putative ABC transport system substrate-binding protein